MIDFLQDIQALEQILRSPDRDEDKSRLTSCDNSTKICYDDYSFSLLFLKVKIKYMFTQYIVLFTDEFKCRRYSGDSFYAAILFEAVSALLTWQKLDGT